MPRPSSVWLAGLGAHIPEHKVANDTICKITGVSHEWIVERTGIHHRFFSRDGEKTSGLAARAVREALAQARIRPRAVQLLVLATSFPDSFPPSSTAEAVRRKLGLTNAYVVDLNTPLTGFLYGLKFAQETIGTGQLENAVVVGAEAFSSTCDLTDRRICYLYSDGAGAMVLSGARGFARVGPIEVGSGPAAAAVDPWAQGEGGTEPLTLYGPQVPGLQHDLGRAFAALRGALVTARPRRAARRAGRRTGPTVHLLSQQVRDAPPAREAHGALRLFSPFADTAYLLAASPPLSLHALLTRGEWAKGDRAVLFATSGRGTWCGAVVELTGAPVRPRPADRPTVGRPAQGPAASRDVLPVDRVALARLLEGEARRADVGRVGLACLTFKLGIAGQEAWPLLSQVDREAGQILKGHTRTGDVLLRLDQAASFAVVLRDVDLEDARRLQTRLAGLLRAVDLAGELGIDVQSRLTMLAQGKAPASFAREVVAGI